MKSPMLPSLRLELQQLPPASVPGIALLARPIEWMRYCVICDRDERFVADMECVAGLIGRCAKCGDERIAPFTRTNSDAAVWKALT